MAKKNRMTVHERDGFAVMDMGEIEIWDGADLALLRETLFQLIDRDGRRKIGVEMTHVKYVPSGFFGMLYDWHEKGTAVRLYSPQARIVNMLWFRQFFELIEGEMFKLLSEPKHQMAPAQPAGWKQEIPWKMDAGNESIAAGSSNESR